MSGQTIYTPSCQIFNPAKNVFACQTVWCFFTLDRNHLAVVCTQPELSACPGQYLPPLIHQDQGFTIIVPSGLDCLVSKLIIYFAGNVVITLLIWNCAHTVYKIVQSSCYRATNSMRRCSSYPHCVTKSLNIRTVSKLHAMNTDKAERNLLLH